METYKSYLSFMVGNEYFASSVDQVQTIVEYKSLTKVPGYQNYMLGLLELRGQALPVVDLRIKLGINDLQIDINSCILIMEVEINKEKTKVGVLVDAVSEVFEVDAQKVKQPPQVGTYKSSKFIEGIYPYNDQFIMLLNSNTMLTDSNLNITN